MKLAENELMELLREDPPEPKKRLRKALDSLKKIEEPVVETGRELYEGAKEIPVTPILGE